MVTNLLVANHYLVEAVGSNSPSGKIEAVNDQVQSNAAAAAQQQHHQHHHTSSSMEMSFHQQCPWRYGN